MKKLLFILCLFIGFVAKAQTYNPSIAGVTMNKPAGIAQAVSTDARSYFYDTANFLWRRYQSVNEVLSYLNLPKYRTGQFSVYIDSGGILQSNGIFIGGVTQEWWFKDSTGNANLIQKFSSNSGGGGSGVTSVSATSSAGYTWSISNPTTTPNISLLLTAAGDLSGFWPDITVAKFNGQLPSFYQNYNNLFNVPTIPAQVNLIAGANISITGGYPNLTIAANNFLKDTIYAKYPLYSISLDTIAVYYVDTAFNDGVLSVAQYKNLYYKQNPIQWNDGSNNLENPGFYSNYTLGTNLTADTVGNTITLNANNASTNNLVWLNSSNAVVAALGAGKFIRGGTGISTIKTGTDTVTLSVIPDTVFARNLLSAAGTDTMDFGGRASFNTTASMTGAFSLKFDSLQAGFYLGFLGHKSTLLSTDSVLINDAGGQVWKVPSTTFGAITGATNGLSTFSGGTLIGLNGTFSQSNTETQNAFTMTFSGSGAKTVEVDNSAAFAKAFKGVASGGSSTGVYGQGGSIGVDGNSTGSTTTVGVHGASDEGIGVFGYSSQNAVVAQNLSYAVGVQGVSDNTGIPVVAQSQTFNFNTLTTAIQLVDIPSGGTATTGFGSSLDYILTNGSGSQVKTSGIASAFTNATGGSEATSLQIYNINAGTLQLQGQFKSTGQLQLNNYTGSAFTTVDTVNNKQLVVNTTTGAINVATNWSLGGGGGTSLANQNVTSGSSSTISAGQTIVTFNPSSSIAAYTLTLPASPNNNDVIIIRAGGTIPSGVVVTSFTLSANGGQTITDPNPPTFLTAGDSYKIRWSATYSTWYVER